MKVLRILRRRKIRLSFILLLLSIFIFTTYAWFNFDRNVEGGGLVANVSTWAVEFIIEGEEIQTETFELEIDDIYPGMDSITKEIDIYNLGEAPSELFYEIEEMYLFGEKIIDNETVADEVAGTNTVDLFGKSSASIFTEGNTNYSYSLKYPTPFSINYSYDKEQISGQGGDDTAHAVFKIDFEWENKDENDEEDTKLGTLSYNYEKNHEGEPAIKIAVKITAKRWFPE